MIVKLLTEHHLEFLTFKRRLHRLVRVCTCQNTTLLEITCHDSFHLFSVVLLYQTFRKVFDVQRNADCIQTLALKENSLKHVLWLFAIMASDCKLP